MRTFDHSFEPPSASPAGATVQLSAREIEDAGVYEVLQTPGAALGSWAILDALLDPNSSEFIFREPLGHSREVKTALSGLFGRFVARAYLTRYLGFTHFAHITKPPMRLRGISRGRVVRRPGHNGDLPDWVIWNVNTTQIAVAEAKGCHDAGGPEKALARAWTQVQRVMIEVNRKTVSLKRYAIATRWSASNSRKPVLSVHDPEEKGNATPQEHGELGIGIARLHFASLLRPLGHFDLADALTAAVRATSQREEQENIRRANTALAQARDRRRVGSKAGTVSVPDHLIGGFVTRGGPIDRALEISLDDQKLFRRLGFRPVFVGIERDVLSAAIEGNTDNLTVFDVDAVGLDTEVPSDGRARRSRAGTWLIRLDEDEVDIA